MFVNNVCPNSFALFEVINYPGGLLEVQWSFDGVTEFVSGTEPTLSFEVLYSPQTFFARFYDATNMCYSDWNSVTSFPNLPSPPKSISGGERCGNGDVTFTANIPSNPDETIEWSLDGSVVAGTGGSFVLPVIQGNDLPVYVRTYNTVSGCATSFFASSYTATANACGGGADPSSSTSVAGSGVAGNANGTGTSASFKAPMGMLFDADEDLILIADAQNHKIRGLNLISGNVNTFTGSGTPGFEGGEYPGGSFNSPVKVLKKPGSNEYYVVDRGNHAIRQLAFGGVNNYVGTGGAGYTNGTFAVASFNAPTSAVYLNDKLYVVDHGNHCIRVVDLVNETVATLAGNGTPGYVDGLGGEARFKKPWGITTDGSMLYVTDYGNHAIRAVSLSGSVSTLVGNGTPGYVDGSTSTARLKYPTGLVEKSGKLYFADHGNHCVRELSGGIVSTLSGNGTPGTQEGPASTYLSPMDVVLVGADLYVVDAFTHTLRRLQP
jgi:hypothetical protein